MVNALKMMKLDFYSTKSGAIKYLLLIVLGLVFLVDGKALMSVYIICSLFTALMVSNVFVVQEKNNLSKLYGLVAIKSDDVVLGRYLYSASQYVISFAIIFVLYCGVSLFLNNPIILLDIMLGFGVSFLTYSLITGVHMPLLFKMGYIKAKGWSMVTIMIVMTIAIALSQIGALSATITLIVSSKYLLTFCALLLGCAIQVVSCCIAIKIYRKKR